MGNSPTGVLGELSVAYLVFLKVISDTKEPLSTAVDSDEEDIRSTLAEVKNAVAGATGFAPETAQGMESTRGQKGASNPFATLWKSDAWLDSFLPVVSQQLGKCSKTGLCFSSLIYS